MFGTTVPVEWRGRQVDAFVPVRLDGVELPLSPAAGRAAARAEGALAVVDDRMHAGLEVPARPLLRAEGLASSRIEDVHAPVADVAVADVDPAVTGSAGWVADNLRALDRALAHDGPLTVDALRVWHELLMRHSSLRADLVGAWRDAVGWVGGANPLQAAHVPPPPELVDELVVDLVRFANGTTLDPVTQAAVVHAQFETIHPFADGNGRIGRILIGWVLVRRLDLLVPPPVSGVFLRDRGGYLGGLTRYRVDGPDPWVRWFAGALDQSVRSIDTILAEVAAVVAGWPARLHGVRADAAARVLVDHLVARPALDARTAAVLAGVSEQAARTALDELTRRGILRPAADVSNRRWWVAGEVLDLLAS
jgi:hypothetical protein